MDRCRLSSRATFGLKDGRRDTMKMQAASIEPMIDKHATSMLTDRRLTAYFLKLGTIGFGGPVALAGFMHRDLVDRYAWISDDDYNLALALAQIMPGPLAAQLAIAIGY